MIATATATATAIADRLRGGVLHGAYDYVQLRRQGVERVACETPAGRFDLAVPVAADVRSKLEAGYEPVLTDALAADLGRGDVFYDVGSRFGYFVGVALAAGVRPRDVFAFEPRLASRRVLLDNFGDLGVDVSGKRVGFGPFPVSFSEGVDVVKVDVEGDEFEVVAAIERALEVLRPRIYVEVHPAALGDDKLAALRSLLEGCDYELSFCDHRLREARWRDRPLEDAPTYLLRGVPT